MSHRPAKYLTMEEVAYLAYQAFEKIQPNERLRKELAATATAIAWAESKGNYNAHNDNYKHGGRDDSYGLWQINMLGSMGDRRLKFFGIKTRDDLFDVNNNAVAMSQLYVNKGRTFTDWSTYNLGLHRVYIIKARNAVENRKAPSGNKGRDERAEAVANDPMAKFFSGIGDVLSGEFLNPIIDFVKTGMLRVAGFVGGGVLLILAIVLYVRGQK